MEIEANNNARAVAALSGLLFGMTPKEVRIGAIEGLGRAGGEAALTKLLMLLEEPLLPEVRAACARAIGEAGRICP